MDPWVTTVFVYSGVNTVQLQGQVEFLELICCYYLVHSFLICIQADVHFGKRRIYHTAVEISRSELVAS